MKGVILTPHPEKTTLKKPSLVRVKASRHSNNMFVSAPFVDVII